MEKTLVLIKPDAMQRGFAGEILIRLEKRGLRIVAMKLIQIGDELARQHYSEHEGKPFYAGLIDYITSSPVVAVVFEGTNAVLAVRATVGSTNPVEAAVGSIRGDLGLEMGRNLVHASDSVESGIRESSIFFEENEIYAWTRSIDTWVFE
jgi:nucleoside-diphosphate kinase